MGRRSTMCSSYLSSRFSWKVMIRQRWRWKRIISDMLSSSLLTSLWDPGEGIMGRYCMNDVLFPFTAHEWRPKDESANTWPFACERNELVHWIKLVRLHTFSFNRCINWCCWCREIVKFYKIIVIKYFFQFHSCTNI